MTVKKILIANRGEIAVRIIRAAHAAGKEAVAVYSDADREAMHTLLADEATPIGPAAATRSYLDAEKIIDAALRTGADAVHPGYGFLAENAGFARACEEAGLKFIGPSAEVIARMGDKSAARATAQEAGVPIVPGTPDLVQTLEEATKAADTIGYPVMIKAAAGGGGRGIRVADNDGELAKLVPLAQQEAKAAFGDGAVYLERLIRRARHVEVQVLGDGQDAVHFFERECSLQRRRQKMVEEALSPYLTPLLRQEMTAAAVCLAEAVGYEGAGTVEFLVDPESDQFYFIEMNTRIQVEHPVTEMVCGVDLVQEQIRIADGHRLDMTQDEIRPHGWAIECRINAENPDMEFMPSPGTIRKLAWPEDEDVRVDTALFDGYTIPPYYDSLIAKLIVWGQTREEAIQKTRQSLDLLTIEGVHTTTPMLRRLMDDDLFNSGVYHTGYLREWLLDYQSQEVIR